MLKFATCNVSLQNVHGVYNVSFTHSIETQTIIKTRYWSYASVQNVRIKRINHYKLRSQNIGFLVVLVLPLIFYKSVLNLLSIVPYTWKKKNSFEIVLKRKKDFLSICTCTCVCPNKGIIHCVGKICHKLLTQMVWISLHEIFLYYTLFISFILQIRRIKIPFFSCFIILLISSLRSSKFFHFSYQILDRYSIIFLILLFESLLYQDAIKTSTYFCSLYLCMG